jgi:hypothetical protein
VKQLENWVAMQEAKVVRAIAHTTNVQVLCTDERGLLSVYFEPKPFVSFYKMVKNAGLKFAGLQIEFNREMVRIPSIGKTGKVCFTRRKTLRTLFSN